MRTSFDKRRLLSAFCLVLLLALSFAAVEIAQAQQTAPGAPANPAAGSSGANQGAPTASQLALARRLVVASGMSRSFSIVIPQFMDQIATALTQTRPELIRDLNTVLTDLKPEFDKQADEMVDIAAQIYVKRMSEQDLRTAVTFFESPAGKQYVDTQPAFLTDVVTAMQGWQGKISTDMMTRVRVEMKQKGHEL
ncbi:DUF2059 domain-containing protein [Methylocapsa polymorpha]|uniref:DUF2059 domain-containing protein n=1 Tax=Methylocapsa polymorpha TaxID=3080828 RepID=A0ABZ0HPB9_9HYPH|nr:DUF2059 domain-containing protein [Methylocapsa sp. RX1]